MLHTLFGEEQEGGEAFHRDGKCPMRDLFLTRPGFILLQDRVSKGLIAMWEEASHPSTASNPIYRTEVAYILIQSHLSHRMASSFAISRPIIFQGWGKGVRVHATTS